MSTTDSLAQQPPLYWQEGCVFLSQHDETLRIIIQKLPSSVLLRRSNAFYSLVRAIIGQQVSVLSAQAIWNKLLAFYPTLTPAEITTAKDEVFSACGLSKNKTRYIRALAEFFRQEPQEFWQQPAPILREKLLAIPGIGPWTWQMFAIFYLQLPDEFPLKDIGIQRAIRQHYGINDLAAMEALSKKWQPYRTIATWFLWRTLDPVEVNY